MKRLSVIVPCYNEEKNVAVFFEAITKVFKDINNIILELVFVNDGSKDQTWKELKKLVGYDSCEVKILSFSRNFGKEAAMFAGFENASGDYVSIIDADMQQDPALLIKMLEVLEKDDEYDTVAFYQEKRKESAMMTFFKDRFYGLINKFADVEFVQGASDFRMFRRSVVDSILKMGENNRFSKGIFSWVGFNTCYLPYTVNERMHGTSTWSFGSLFKYAMSGIISFTTAPLRISTIIGSFMGIISFIYLVTVVLQKLICGIAIPGYTTIVVLILFIGGIQLLCLGIIGEYIARTYVETKRRPIYIIKDAYTNKEL